jgi:hypothetical protein
MKQENSHDKLRKAAAETSHAGMIRIGFEGIFSAPPNYWGTPVSLTSSPPKRRRFLRRCIRLQCRFASEGSCCWPRLQGSLGRRSGHALPSGASYYTSFALCIPRLKDGVLGASSIKRLKHHSADFVKQPVPFLPPEGFDQRLIGCKRGYRQAAHLCRIIGVAQRDRGLGVRQSQESLGLAWRHRASLQGQTFN